jgi:hypothetical protein
MRLPDLQLSQKVGQFIASNASGLLTAGGVVGVGATAVLTARASFKAAAILREKQAIAEEAQAERVGIRMDVEFSTREKAMIVWPYYVPPAVVGTATISSIIMANRISSKRAAALAAAYAISENRLQEYKDKVTEKLGINKERSLRDEIAQDQVNNDPPSKEVLILGSGDVLCRDSLSGRYFHSSVEMIKRAENKINTELFNSQYASLSEFYDEIGLEATDFSDQMGWNTMNMEPFEIKFSTTMSPDNRPCLVLDYSTLPIPDYHKLY